MNISTTRKEPAKASLRKAKFGSWECCLPPTSSSSDWSYCLQFQINPPKQSIFKKVWTRFILVSPCLFKAILCHWSSGASDQCQLKRVESARSGLRPRWLPFTYYDPGGVPSSLRGHVVHQPSAGVNELLSTTNIFKTMAFLLFDVGHWDAKQSLVGIRPWANELFSPARQLFSRN